MRAARTGRGLEGRYYNRLITLVRVMKYPP